MEGERVDDNDCVLSCAFFYSKLILTILEFYLANAH